MTGWAFRLTGQEAASAAAMLIDYLQDRGVAGSLWIRIWEGSKITKWPWLWVLIHPIDGHVIVY